MTCYGKKWLGGLDWSQIDADGVLHLSSGEKIDLSECLIVMEELNCLPKIPDSGPIIIYEPQGIPYLENEYHTRWRKVANAIGIPKSTRNTRHPRRDRADAPVDKKHACEIAARVCKSLPDSCRDGVCSEMVIDLYEKKIRPDQLAAARSKYVARYFKNFENRYEISLDQTLAGGRRLGDTVSSDHNVWRG